jgi:hypothetical protein
LIIETKFVCLEFNRVMSLFFRFLNFKLFLLNRLRLRLSCYLLALFLWFLFFCLFFLWNFSFLDPLLNQSAFFKSNETVLIMLNFKANSECLVLGHLCWSSIVPNMLIEPIHRWLVFNKNFNWLSSFEFDSFRRRNFGSEVINHFSLILRILCRV